MPQDDVPEILLNAVEPTRRAFVRKLIVTSGFATPIVSSFTMGGVAFGQVIAPVPAPSGPNLGGPGGSNVTSPVPAPPQGPNTGGPIGPNLGGPGGSNVTSPVPSPGSPSGPNTTSPGPSPAPTGPGGSNI